MCTYVAWVGLVPAVVFVCVCECLFVCLFVGQSD